MGHDHVLRFNIRRIADIPDAPSKRPFGASTHGSHHISLVDYVAKRWNSLLETVGATEFESLPVLIEIDSDEEFGIVHSEHASSFGGFYKLNLKDELEEGEEDDADILASVEILTDPIDLSVNVDPIDLLIPATRASEPQASHSLSTSAASSTALPSPHCLPAAIQEQTIKADRSCFDVAPDPGFGATLVAQVQSTAKPDVIVRLLPLICFFTADITLTTARTCQDVMKNLMKSSKSHVQQRVLQQALHCCLHT